MFIAKIGGDALDARYPTVPIPSMLEYSCRRREAPPAIMVRISAHKLGSLELNLVEDIGHDMPERSTTF
jgi:hypothetical protein